MTADDMRALPPPQGCPGDCHCAGLRRAAGWESIPQALGPPLLCLLGTLCPPGDDEATLEEWPGSRFWAADAPIAPGHFPFNRCQVWACARCGCGFLQYTEFGGYYVDHRIRELDPARLV